jgi:topoisomerase-4 subunit A
VAEQEAVYAVLEEALSPFFHLLSRTPEKADYDTLLAIPIRRIARFDRERHQQEIKKLHKHLETIRKNLKNLREYCIDYLESLVQRFGDQFPRKTFCQAIEVVDRRAIETKEVTIGFDPKTGYFGTKVAGSRQFQGTNFDKVLVLYKSGAYKVVSLSEKQYIGQEKDEVVHIGIADKSTTFAVIYRDKKSGFAYAKKFIVKQFILGKVYEFLVKEQELLFFTTQPEAKLLLQLMPKPRQRQTLIELDLATFLVKGVTAHGVRVTGRHVMKVTEKK